MNDDEFRRAVAKFFARLEREPEESRQAFLDAWREQLHIADYPAREEIIGNMAHLLGLDADG